MRDGRYISLSALALSSAAMVLAGVFGAATNASPTAGLRLGRMLSVGSPGNGNPHGKTLYSLNWSGYIAAAAPKYGSVAASWQEPAGSCRGGDQYSSFWAGLDGLHSKTVEQIGTEVDCHGNTPIYYAWYELYPAAPVKLAGPVKPADKISASVTATAGGSFVLKISDAGKWTVRKKVDLPSAKRASAEVIAEAPCCTASGGILPLADFGTVRFTGAMVNGTPLGDLQHTEIVMQSGPVYKDEVSAITHAADFGITWLHS